MGYIKTIPSAIAIVVAIGLSSTASLGDEVVLDGKSGSQLLGDFDCSECPSASNKIDLFDGRESGSVSAGQLWQMFKDRGVSSVDRLTFSLDLEEHGASESFGIDSVKLTIEDSAIFGGSIRTYSSGEQSLKIHGYDLTAFKPEANLEIQLDYDFMTRFSSESTERISFAVSSDENSKAKISVAPNQKSVFFTPDVLPYIGAFVMFWALVFIVLNRSTKAQVVVPETKSVSPQKRQALSA